MPQPDELQQQIPWVGSSISGVEASYIPHLLNAREQYWSKIHDYKTYDTPSVR